MGVISSDGIGEGGDEPMASINVTSLVDVMFCLLIMFMVATPLMSKDQMKVKLPKAKLKSSLSRSKTSVSGADPHMVATRKRRAARRASMSKVAKQ